MKAIQAGLYGHIPDISKLHTSSFVVLCTYVHSGFSFPLVPSYNDSYLPSLDCSVTPLQTSPGRGDGSPQGATPPVAADRGSNGLHDRPQPGPALPGLGSQPRPQLHGRPRYAPALPPVRRHGRHG